MPWLTFLIYPLIPFFPQVHGTFGTDRKLVVPGILSSFASSLHSGTTGELLILGRMSNSLFTTNLVIQKAEYSSVSLRREARMVRWFFLSSWNFIFFLRKEGQVQNPLASLTDLQHHMPLCRTSPPGYYSCRILWTVKFCVSFSKNTYNEFTPGDFPTFPVFRRKFPENRKPSSVLPHNHRIPHGCGYREISG